MPGLDIDKLSSEQLGLLEDDDLDKLLDAVRKAKASRTEADMSQVKPYIDSVRKHVSGILVSIHKMTDKYPKVPERAWTEIESKLSEVDKANYRVHALATAYTKREGKGSRKRRNPESQS